MPHTKHFSIHINDQITKSFVLKNYFRLILFLCFSLKCCQTHLLRVNRLKHPQFDLFVSSNSILYVFYFFRSFLASRCLLKQCAKILFVSGWKSFHLEIFTKTSVVVNLLIFVTFMSSPVWWQSMSRWWWFMTSDGWNPPRWFCSGSCWCAIGPWPPCTSAITMDGFWFL